MEALLHFVIPLVALVLIGVDVFEALPLAVLAVVPDMDILFHVHRSPTHSMVLITLAAAPFMIFYWWRRSTRFNTSILGYLSALSHPLLDVFSGYTPVLWPLYKKSLWVESSLMASYGSRVKLELVMELHRAPITFAKQPIFTGALFSGRVLIISLILLTAISYKIYTRRG